MITKVMFDNFDKENLDTDLEKYYEKNLLLI